MPSKKKGDMHVTPSGDGWQVKREGADKASKRFGTQRDAIDWGTDRARKEKGEFFIHGRDGRIRDRDSYGNDPHPPKDTKH